MIMRERIIWKKNANVRKIQDPKKNWIRWIELRKHPIVQGDSLGFGTLYKVDGLNHYANLSTYGLRENQNSQFSI